MRPDEESSRKPVTVQMKLRDLARPKGLARKLDTKYQTLMMELIAEGWIDEKQPSRVTDRAQKPWWKRAEQKRTTR